MLQDWTKLLKKPFLVSVEDTYSYIFLVYGGFFHIFILCKGSLVHLRYINYQCNIYPSTLLCYSVVHITTLV
jgi:hypothetical protein